MARGGPNGLFVGQFRYIETRFQQMSIFHCSPNLGQRVIGTPRGVLHLKTTRVAENLMPNIKSGTERKTRIARRRLNENLFERHAVEDFSVSHAIECHTAGETERLLAGLPIESAYPWKQNFLQPRLQARGY